MIRYILICFQVLILLMVASPLSAVENKHDSQMPESSLTTLDTSIVQENLPLFSDLHENEIAINAVKRQIALFTERIREKFSLWLSRSGKYLDLMRNILKEQEVPEDIVFLPLIESGFNPNAYSPAKAAGYWQFIASTAQRYGLEINWWRDERKDPIKSTIAAANYLKDLYSMFGSWNLAMAAYNAGEGKIMKALKNSSARDYWALLTTDQIKNETKDYVPKFIAASLIAYSPETYGFDDLEFHPPLSYETVVLESPIDLDVAAECAGVSVAVIRELNPELKRWCTPPDVREYHLRIPEGSKEMFLDTLSRIPEKKRFTVDRYVVKKGDTIKRISKKTGVPVGVILDLNDMEKIIPLRSGKIVYLPPKKSLRQGTESLGHVKRVSMGSKKPALSGKKGATSMTRALKIPSQQKRASKSLGKKI